MNTYTKLKSGAWGVRVSSPAKTGAVVTVKTKAGAKKQETIEQVIWEGNGVAICTIKPTAFRASAYGASAYGWRNNGCSECRRRGDWCPQCAFDEFDN